MSEPDPSQRTAWNVRDADATLVFTQGRTLGGTALTLELARNQGRPHLLLDLENGTAVAEISAWLAQVRPRTLNVAGPRESEAPGIAEAVQGLLQAALASRGDA